MAPKTVDDLRSEYPDAEWQHKFADICDLLEILGDCTIADTYHISDALNDSIALTPAGAEIRDKLVTKKNVRAKEAKLMCALTLGHQELFVDVERTDISAVAAAIDAELKDERIRLPFIFGRELYDRYADTHEDEKDSLTAEESVELMRTLPAGVFQYGHYTIGPYGLKRAETRRSIQSTRHVPAFHCSRTTCRRIHPVLLETSRAAPINRNRDKLEELLDSIPGDPAEWWAFAADITGYSVAYYGDQRTATLLPLLGDALSIEELRGLIEDLLDNTGGRLRGALSAFATIRAAADFTAPLNRAQLLQLSLFVSEAEIITSLDRLVSNGTIVVPVGEVRRAVTTEMIKSGAFSLRAELGHYGVRFASEDAGFPLLRERRLFDKLYLRGETSDLAELEWQLRGVGVDDLDERLDHFFHTTQPREAIRRLVLARRTNMEAACAEVGIADGLDLSDPELVDTLMWKLGFEVVVDDDPHEEFWRRHEQLWALTQSSDIGASDRFRESASPYFTQLEGLLLDSLAFTAWALLTDHINAEVPFSYHDEGDRAEGLTLMNSIAPSPSGSSDYLADRVDLSNLISGFSALARRLDECAADKDSYARPPMEVPEYDGKTDIKAFLLRSTVPYLDLTAPSQSRIVSGLREITRVLSEADVHLVRNDYAHYRRSVPDISRMETALNATHRAVTRIETLGFARLLFRPSSTARDAWGRTLHSFAGPRSYEHEFIRPSRYDWMGLPPLTGPAYLMRSASIGEPTEVLRFTRRYSSSYSDLWDGYPRRRRKPRTTSVESPETYDQPVQPHSR